MVILSLKLVKKANGNISPIKCRISDTHLFSLLQLMKTVLYPQTFHQKQDQIDTILLCALLDLIYYTDEFSHILFEIIEIPHTDDEQCPIASCERFCFEMTTDLDETRLQVFFLPVNVYAEDSIVRNKTDQHLSTRCLQLSSLSIRGHAMLSHEGLPPERETLEYAGQMEIILDSISARLTTNQLEKTLGFVKKLYLQIMEDEYTLTLGNAVNVQIAPICLCMCNMHTSLCNESLTLKNLVQKSVRESRINAKFEYHPPTPATTNEQLEFLRRDYQHSQRPHFLYNPKSQQTLNIPTISTNLKRPSYVGLATNYYTLVQDE
ncbi:unnamed protein product [Adineta steineri]|uniref:Uncharacterized protein n=1 Tax=Adineta steineri TaxID=433720 RepID=A0A816ESP0_9BILA|nr:unnamed protein product [Adineta steineri]CAF1653347.1 unnamed protein product [Adineta steineri]